MNKAAAIRGLILVTASLFSACLAKMETQDPLAGLDAQAAPEAEAAPLFPDLKLGLVESANTRNAAAPLERASRLWCATAIFGRTAFDHRKIVADYIDDLRKDFKSVTPLQKVEDAAAAGVDLIGVLDVYPTFPGANGVGVLRMDAAIVFLDTRGRQYASVKTNGMEGNDKPDTAAPTFLRVNKLTRRNLQHELESNRVAVARQKADSAAPVAAAPAAPRTFSSEVDRPSYKAPEDPSRFALVVGIEQYAALPPADHAERDAQAMRDHLLALGVPQRNTVYLGGKGATRTSIEKYVESWLPRSVDAASRVFVYFSGHGAPDPRTGQAYLVPWDGDPKYLETTGYPILRLYERLGSLKAKEVVVALDSCFSGAGGRSVLAKGTRPLVMRVDTGVEKHGNIAVLSASGDDEVSGTDESQGHGVFTYYLLKALNEAGGKTSVRGAYDYLKPKVQDAARKDNRDQTPQLHGRLDAAAL